MEFDGVSVEEFRSAFLLPPPLTYDTTATRYGDYGGGVSHLSNNLSAADSLLSGSPEALQTVLRMLCMGQHGSEWGGRGDDGGVSSRQQTGTRASRRTSRDGVFRTNIDSAGTCNYSCTSQHLHSREPWRKKNGGEGKRKRTGRVPCPLSRDINFTHSFGPDTTYGNTGHDGALGSSGDVHGHITQGASLLPHDAVWEQTEHGSHALLPALLKNGPSVEDVVALLETNRHPMIERRSESSHSTQVTENLMRTGSGVHCELRTNVTTTDDTETETANDAGFKFSPDPTHTSFVGEEKSDGEEEELCEEHGVILEEGKEGVERKVYTREDLFRIRDEMPRERVPGTEIPGMPPHLLRSWKAGNAHPSMKGCEQKKKKRRGKRTRGGGTKTSASSHNTEEQQADGCASTHTHDCGSDDEDHAQAVLGDETGKQNQEDESDEEGCQAEDTLASARKAEEGGSTSTDARHNNQPLLGPSSPPSTSPHLFQETEHESGRDVELQRAVNSAQGISHTLTVNPTLGTDTALLLQAIQAVEGEVGVLQCGDSVNLSEG